MIDFAKLRRSFLESLLSLHASISHVATGSSVQAALLRGMGAEVAGPVDFGRHASFVWPHQLRLGRYVCIGDRARIVCWGPITVGDDFLAGDGLTLNSGSHDVETAAPVTAGIVIGSRVWCGANVTVCSGVTVGSDVVIGAGAVVVRDLPDGCVAAGVPARVLRPLERAPDAPLWSPWAERSSHERYAKVGKVGKFFYRLRARI